MEFPHGSRRRLPANPATESLTSCGHWVGGGGEVEEEDEDIPMDNILVSAQPDQKPLM